jgi:hypothetical protein
VEYTFRYDKHHKTEQMLQSLVEYSELYMKPGKLLPFANCTRLKLLNIDFREMTDTEEAYRKYLCAKWHSDKRVPGWKNRERPSWYNI